MKPALPLPASRRDLLRWGSFGTALLAAPAVMGQGVQTFRLGLEGRVDGSQSSFYLALDRGFFRDEGLLVTLESGGSSRDILARLASGTLDLGLCDTSAMIRFRDEVPAPDLRAVMMMQDRAPFAIVGRKSRGITQEVRSLEGKKLGAPAADNAVAAWPVFRSLNQIAANAVTLETIGLPVREPMLASGEIDGAFGSGASLFVNLKARNVPVDDLVVLAMADYGLMLYGNAVVAGAALRQNRGEAIAAFSRACLRAVRMCFADPGGSVEPVLRVNETLRRDVEVERLQMMMRQDVVTRWVQDNGFGGVDGQRLETGLAQMALAQPFKTKISAGDIFDGRFLTMPAERLL